MINTKDELINEYVVLLSKASDAHKESDPITEEEYRKLEQGIYSSSGETEWSLENEKPIIDKWVQDWEKQRSGGGETEWNPEQEEPEEMLPGWPKKVTLEDGSERVFKSPKEWREHAKDRTPLSMRDKPTEKKQEYSDEEYFEMIKKEPEHVATNLVLQRKPPYNQFKYVYPLVKELVDWATESNIPIEKNSMLYGEISYMLDIVEKEAKQRSTSKEK